MGTLNYSTAVTRLEYFLKFILWINKSNMVRESNPKLNNLFYLIFYFIFKIFIYLGT